jgi:hypothetical protein
MADTRTLERPTPRLQTVDLQQEGGGTIRIVAASLREVCEQRYAGRVRDHGKEGLRRRHDQPRAGVKAQEVGDVGIVGERLIKPHRRLEVAQRQDERGGRRQKRRRRS